TVTPATPGPLDGFGIDQTALLDIRETETFQFSAPVGRSLYIDAVVSNFRVPTHTITLNAGETYLVRDALGENDLTGTIVTSNNPVAAFGSHIGSFIPNGFGFADHLVEQLTPTNTWGREFVTVPLAGRLRGDTFRF